MEVVCPCDDGNVAVVLLLLDTSCLRLERNAESSEFPFPLFWVVVVVVTAVADDSIYDTDGRMKNLSFQRQSSEVFVQKFFLKEQGFKPMEEDDKERKKGIICLFLIIIIIWIIIMKMRKGVVT